MAARDTSENRKDRELQDLRNEVVALRSRISLVSDISRRITASLDLPSVLQEVVDSACELTQSRYAALAVFDESGHASQFFTCGISDEIQEQIGDVPQGLGLLGFLHELQQPLRLSDLSRHPSSVGFPPNHPPMTTFLGAPIRYGEEHLGNLYLTEKLDGQEYSPEDEDLLVLFCAQAASAIHNAHLHQSVEAERSRVDAILSNYPDGIIFVDAVTGHIRANRRAEEMLDHSFSPSDGPAALEARILDPQGSKIPLEKSLLSRALQREYIAGEELLVIHGDGSSFPILSSAAAIIENDGTVLGAVLQFQDMTSVKQAQKELSESESRYRAILDNSPAVIYIKDTEGRYLLINRQYELLFNVTQEGMKGKTDLDIFPREAAELLQANDRRVLESGVASESEEVVQHEDGAHTYLSIKFPFRGSSGEIHGICGISTDITDRKRAEGEVQTERQRLQVMVDTSPVGIVLANAVTNEIVVVNREAERIIGIHREPGDLVGRYEDAIVYRRPDGGIYAAAELPMQRALSTGEATRAEEIRFEFPDGHSIPTLVNATPVYSASGEITAAIAVIQDITPLEEIEKLRSEFLGIISHELRTPLTAIKGSAATVLGSRRPVNDAETREFFQIIDEQADRLRDLVDNLSDMTRIEAGSLSVNAEPTDFGEVLEEAKLGFIRSASSQEIKLQVPEELPLVEADSGRIAQVLNNLLSNAAKFSPGLEAINIQVEFDSVYLTIRVRDEGRGIPPEKLPDLFRKFSRIHDESGRNVSGSGLGLAICKGIVEAHGGRIWAESPGLGLGSTFSFTLPISSATKVNPQPDVTKRAVHIGRVSRSGERTRILAVDDEPQTLRYLQRTLDEAGYQPLVTSDSEDVIKLVELEEPDLVLMDINLPGVNGFDLLQQIREFSGVPVVFLSSSNQDEDIVKALNMGADDYITKPFAPAELLARVEVALRRRLLPDQVEVRPDFAIGDLRIAFAQRMVTLSGEPVSLTATEYKLLYELANHAGMVLTHDQILHRVWGPEYGGETELVRSFIRNLRRKLGDDARNPRYIFTEPQVGYRVPRPRA